MSWPQAGKMQALARRGPGTRGRVPTGRVPALQAGCCGFDSRRPLAWVANALLCRQHLARHHESARRRSPQPGNNRLPGRAPSAPLAQSGQSSGLLIHWPGVRIPGGAPRARSPTGSRQRIQTPSSAGSTPAGPTRTDDKAVLRILVRSLPGEESGCHSGGSKDRRRGGVWGNWQPAGFWPRQSRFESWYPSSSRRALAAARPP
jgi:hypothetical protein